MSDYDDYDDFAHMIRVAERRGFQLLQSYMDNDQLAVFLTGRQFPVIGSKGGTYMVESFSRVCTVIGVNLNEFTVEDGVVYCVSSKSLPPQRMLKDGFFGQVGSSLLPDAMLTMKLLIELDEPLFRRRANPVGRMRAREISARYEGFLSSSIAYWRKGTNGNS